jgi:TDG/mug DNA glycosylase family protein
MRRPPSDAGLQEVQSVPLDGAVRSKHGVLRLGDSPSLGRARRAVGRLSAELVVERQAHRVPAAIGRAALTAVPDVLAPGLRAVFCGINPGHASAAAGAHFANPRNDFWRLLHDAGFTPRQLEPQEQGQLLEHELGLTNAARRTTHGSGELRARDFERTAERLEALADELRPLVIAFVGKAAYQGTYRERAELGLQERRYPHTLLYVLPSTSPANAAVPYDERLRWFVALYALLHPAPRLAVRAVLMDDADRLLLFRFRSPGGVPFWAGPGGGIEPGESDDEAMHRELREEVGLHDVELGPVVWTRRHVFAWHGIVDQRDRFYLIRAGRPEVAPEVDLTEEGVEDHRWWSLAELERTDEILAPRGLAKHYRRLLEHGPPREPIDVGV